MSALDMPDRGPRRRKPARKAAEPSFDDFRTPIFRDALVKDTERAIPDDISAWPHAHAATARAADLRLRAAFAFAHGIRAAARGEGIRASQLCTAALRLKARAERLEPRG